MSVLCTGGCGKTVTDKGKICPSCWLPVSEQYGSDPKPTPPESDFGLRMEIHNASFRLAFGTKAERPDAIAKLSQLLNQLRK